MDPGFDGHLYRAEEKHPDSAALAHQFSMGGTTIVCAHPNQIKQASLIEKNEPTGPLQQRLVLGGTALGSKDFAAALFEADERLDQAPMTAMEIAVDGPGCT